MYKIDKRDLRIGNMFEQGIVFKISGRAGAKVHLHGKGKWYKGFRTEIDASQLTPILLTPKILTEWCGFEREEEYWNFEGVKLWDSKLDDNGNSKFYHINSELLINLDYLHELQNFYKAISGEELEIKE